MFAYASQSLAVHTFNMYDVYFIVYITSLFQGIVIFLLCMCFFCTVSCGVWESVVGIDFQIYLPWDDLVPKVGNMTIVY